MAEPDYDHLLRSNLERVFNERDPARRAAAVAELFVADPVMFEPDKPVHGREAIAKVAGALLERFEPDFAFTPRGMAVGHHGLGVLHCRTSRHGSGRHRHGRGGDRGWQDRPALGLARTTQVMGH